MRASKGTRMTLHFTGAVIEALSQEDDQTIVVLRPPKGEFVRLKADHQDH